jgi:hypothetical protein
MSKGPAITQEGLALRTEALSFCSHPDRLRRVTNRIRTVDMAEQGADFLEVFGYFCSRGELCPCGEGLGVFAACRGGR